MRSSPSLLAKAARRSARTMMPEVNVLPPIPLYRRILRAHRRLPTEHRFLGDQYVKSEFRLHRDTENPLHIIGFLSSWQQYVEQIEGNKWKDAKIDMQKLEKMSDQQIIQFYELMQSAQGMESEYSSHFVDVKSEKPDESK
ncbi:acetate non-utilizing protein 9, mitochondrial precursor [Myxozyma melibiosi]|uniref:Succinate dehydrogenase assembly factor 3 n=1 Tax=Myxozyma melibiosi TaxID=54550 RepID=A0ABR1FEB2_9ASCO